jgi:RPA family protein
LYAAVTGKPRTYETDDGSVNVPLRPESIAVVENPTRRRWIVETAERTLERIKQFDDPDNHYAEMASEMYDVSLSTFKDVTIQALESLDEDDGPL